MNRIVTVGEFKDIPDRKDFRVFWRRRNEDRVVPIRFLLTDCVFLNTQQGANWCVWIVNHLFKGSECAERLTTAFREVRTDISTIFRDSDAAHQKIRHLSGDWRQEDPAPEAHELAADYFDRIKTQREAAEQAWSKASEAILEEAAEQLTLAICRYIDQVKFLVMGFLKS